VSGKEHALGYEQRATHRKPSESSANRVHAEHTRAREIRHLFSKLNLSAEQAEVIERFSRSLVDEIIRGPIAETFTLTRGPSEPVANVETLHARVGEKQEEIEEKPTGETATKGNTLAVGQVSSRS
jgi:glutamyl-tRNA reductase